VNLTLPFHPSDNPSEVLMPVPVVRILEADDYLSQIHRGAKLLAEGKIIVLPTETVYGATAMLGRPMAVAQLKALRKSESKPLTPHLANRQQAEQFLGSLTPLAKRMMNKLWPGPVGLRFDVPAERRRQVADQLGVAEGDLYEGSSITLRCPDHLVFSDVTGELDGPVAATLVGEPGSHDPEALANQLHGKAEAIFDAGAPRFSKPSTLVKVLENGYEIVRPGVYDERTIRRLMKTTILFVCSGNTCRSPMAEAIARKVLSDLLGTDAAGLEKRGIDIASAGATATAGARATPQGAEAVKALGGDLSRHRSRPLTVELINQADVIYAMTRGHSRAVTAMVPSAEKKVQLLDPSKDIEDPIGGDAELYNALARELWKLIDARLRERDWP
jgi:L-threonylcarbamoyladenylate synthase